MMKRQTQKFFLSVCVACLLCVLAAFAACSPNLPTTNERLDSEEKQLTYRTDSITVCPVEDAYENGWLTKTDLAYAMYYATGKVYTCSKSQWEKYQGEVKKEIKFKPTEECPALDEQVEKDIKRHEYDALPKIGEFTKNLTFEEFEQNFSFRFVGSYNGTFIITDIETIYCLTLRMCLRPSGSTDLFGMGRMKKICWQSDMNKNQIKSARAVLRGRLFLIGYS